MPTEICGTVVYIRILVLMLVFKQVLFLREASPIFTRGNAVLQHTAVSVALNHWIVRIRQMALPAAAAAGR